MRRPTLAWTRAILGTALTASTLSAQQMPPAQDRGADTTPVSVPAVTGREARVSLRSGWNYIKVRRYDRALAYFRDAEKRKVELSDTDLKDLKKGIDTALRGLRESGDGVSTASANNTPVQRDEQVALAGSPKAGSEDTAANPVRLVSSGVAGPQGKAPAPSILETLQVQPVVTVLPRDQFDETPAAATDLAPGFVTSPIAPELEAVAPPVGFSKAPASTTALAPADLPPLTAEEPRGQKTVALTDEHTALAAQEVVVERPVPTSGPASIELTQTGPLPDPTTPAPKSIELSQPASEPASGASAPAQSGAPVKLPQPPVVAAPESANAPATVIDLESVQLPPLGADAETHRTGATLEPPSGTPATPASAGEPPAAQEESLPPLPDMAVPTPAPSAEPTPANDPPAPAPAPAAPTANAESLPPLPANLTATPAPGTPTPAQGPTAAAPAPAPDVPASASAAAGTDTSPSQPPTANPSVPTSPGQPAGETPSSTPEVSSDPSTPAGTPTTSLPPHLQREVDQIVLKQEEEARIRQQTPAGVPQPTDQPSTLGSSPPTRLEITRAPSPTEARPLRAIPVPEEFVPMKRRDWSPNRKYWVAPAVCHQPLYFQDAALERYGHSTEQFFGPLGRYLSYPVDDPTQSNQRNQLTQPFFSAGLFALQIIALPYNVLMDPPWEPEYDLGYYRPGDRIPTDLYYLPLHGVGPPLRGSRY